MKSRNEKHNTWLAQNKTRKKNQKKNKKVEKAENK